MTPSSIRHPSPLPDRLGSAWAVLCALHCMALPLVLFATPALTRALYSFEDPNRGIAMALLHLIRLEPWFIAVGAAISGSVLARGWRMHRRLLPPLAGAMGIAALLCAWHFAAWRGGWLHTPGVALGGLLLVAAHTLNLRALRRQRSSP